MPTTDELLAMAKRCYQRANDATYEDRAEARIDQEYRAGAQWDQQARTSRGEARPTLTINKIASFVNNVVNTYKENRPGIAVHPVDRVADPKTAQVVAGLLRHIFYVSNGDTALDVAFDWAASIGWGYYRLRTDYIDDRSFDQEVLFAPIYDPFTVYYDPYSVELDGSDATECLLTTMVDREVFQQDYPDTEIPSGLLSDADGWLSEDSVQVGEYYYTEYHQERLVQFRSGRTAFRSELRGALRSLQGEIVQERTVMRRLVKWCKLTAFAVLEERDLPGGHIPVIPVYGQRLLVEKKWRNFGLIRWLRDPQRMLNYWESAKTEMLALMPKSKWIGAAGQFEGYEESWASANVSNEAFLEYNTRDRDGTVVGAPQRQYPDPPPQGFIEASLHAGQHMKEISGIYDASVGARSNETSGRAIAERKAQGTTANFHFFDNSMKSLRHAKRICLRWIPTIYDAPRMVRILGEDHQSQLVPINGAARREGGIPAVVHDLTVGHYDVILSTGRNYQSQRQEAAEGMTELIRAFPAIMQVAGDLLVQNLDWPGADQVAKRLRAAMPPQMAEDEDADQSPEQQLQQLQAQLAQLQEQTQALNAYAQQCEQEKQQLGEAHAAMQRDMAIEQRKLDLQEEELRLKGQIEAQKLALEEQKIALQAAEAGVSPAQLQEGLALVVQGLQQQLDAITVHLATIDMRPEGVADPEEADDDSPAPGVTQGLPVETR